jgi:hypothetical protein
MGEKVLYVSGGLITNTALVMVITLKNYSDQPHFPPVIGHRFFAVGGAHLLVGQEYRPGYSKSHI